LLLRITGLSGRIPLSRQTLFIDLQDHVHELDGDIGDITRELSAVQRETEGQTKAINRIERKQNRMVEILQIGRAVKLDGEAETDETKDVDKATEILAKAGISYPFPNQDGPVNVNNLRPGDETL